VQQFIGHDSHGEWLVTVFPAEGNKPAHAEATFRPTEWDTWGAPVMLSPVPAFRSAS
jgi:hypothetical protein